MRIFVSGALILILLYIMRGKYGEIIAVLKGTKIAVFSLGLFIFICAIAVASIRLKLIINTQEIPVTFFEALSLTFIAYFFNNFLPTAVGGDVAKAYYLSKKTGETMGSFTSVFIDRLIGLFTMIFMAFLALVFAGKQVVDERVRYFIYAITAFAVLMIVFMMNRNFARIFSFLLFFLRPIEEKLKMAYNLIHKYKRHNIIIFQSFVTSVVSQALFFSSLGILALSIESPISIIDILLRMPIVGIVSLLPSINGLGLREGSTVVFFGPIIGKENAFAVSMLWLLALLITSLIGGIIYGLSPQFKTRFKEAEKGEVNV